MSIKAMREDLFRGARQNPQHAAIPGLRNATERVDFLGASVQSVSRVIEKDEMGLVTYESYVGLENRAAQTARRQQCQQIALIAGVTLASLVLNYGWRYFNPLD